MEIESRNAQQAAKDAQIVAADSEFSSLGGSADSSLGLATADTLEESWVSLKFTHSGKEYTVDLADSDRVFDLKALLDKLTTVPPERQKIIGLVKGKLPPDQATIRELNLTSGKRFSLIGTPQGHEYKDPALLDLPDVFNDLDIDFSADPNSEAVRKFKNDARNKRKIREAVAALQVNLMNELREGKKLLVLDLDYTILDTKPLTSGALPPSECARPGLHEFLEAVYPYYDICIWSQTSWVWIETKLAELDLHNENRNYKIAFVLDKKPMFTVFSKKDGKDFTHQVKALKIIWTLFPQFSEHNTIHIDDLGRNFALNPNEGLKISPFRDCHTLRASQDRELESLSMYLVHIAASGTSFTTFRHKDWKRVVGGLGLPS
ncbi:hypothetical protein FRC20_006845 [Serendipita sp. 405]|nr:hypothetical protein FRC20_006845 [Serendipita sp. 405]